MHAQNGAGFGARRAMTETATTVAELKAQTRRLATEYAVSRILSEAGELEPTLTRALAVMGQELQWDYCVCWKLGADTMGIVASWQREPERLRAVEAEGRKLELKPGVGFAGRVWGEAKPVWIADIAQEQGFLLGREATAAGLEAGVACPILFRGTVIGLLELLATRGVQPDPDTLAVLVSLAEQIAQYLNHHALEAALRASEARYRHMFEANSAGVHCCTVEGEPVAVNPAFVRMFGFASEAEALACRAETLYVDVSDREALLAQLQRSGRDNNRQLRLRRRDGRLIWVLANTVLVKGTNGGPDMNESVVIDISETKEIERRQWQTSKMEGIGRLAGGIAHDFNNLLTVINGYSDLLLTRLPPEDRMRASLSKIRQAGQRAEALTQQLLAFSRRQSVEPLALNLEQAVTETLGMMAGTLGEGVVVKLRAAPDLGTIRADPDQIGQVVMNLGLNARDAMPEGGELIVELENVDLDEAYLRGHVQAQPGRYVRLSISDTGCGIDAETRKHVFEPFFTTKPQGAGTGLGLATVYGLTTQNHGWIELYSEVGYGTTFKLYFPRVDEGGEAARMTAEQRTGSGSVLLVEDEPEVRALMREVLEAAGYRIRTAANGAEALELAAAETPELLVTDVIMPGMTGPELAAEMEKTRPELPVLFVSGYSEQVVIRRGLALGEGRAARKEYLQKPFAPAALLEKAEQLLNRAARPGAR
jgi:two-component system cell cycle sensor histidine kinase/response regulator CckA